MYKVIKKFHDLKDATKTKNGMVYHEYNVGDEFPRKGHEVSDERIEELAGKENKQGVPLIELVEEEAISKETPETPAESKAANKKAATKKAER